MRLLRILTLTCILAGGFAGIFGGYSAEAHLGDLSYAELTISGRHLAYQLRFAAHLIPGINATDEGRVLRQDVVAFEPAILSWLSDTVRVQTGTEACKPEIDELIGPDRRDDLTIVLMFTCPVDIKGIRVEFRAFDKSLPSYKNITTIRKGEQRWTHVFNTTRPVIMLAGQTSAAGIATLGGSNQAQAPEATTVQNNENGDHGVSGFGGFFRLGVDHILSGYDHLLFLLALLLAPGLGFAQAAGIVTAFTIAHSITLAAAALDLFTLPQRPVEIAIAASIVFVAVENLARRRVSHRWVVTFVFGLIHGFGFAGILREIGLPPGGVVPPLLGFNLGVEAGQIAAVAITLPILAASGRLVGVRNVRVVLSVAIIAVGAYWIVQRV